MRLAAVGIAGLGLGLVVAGALGATRWLDGPLGMLPGGQLQGGSQPCRESGWDAFAGVEEIELEVRPGRPRSLRTWAVVHHGELFVPADFLTPWKRWPHQVIADPRIRLRIGDAIFACVARRVLDPEEIQALRRAIAAKYQLREDGRAARVEVWWFQVHPRSGSRSEGARP